METVDVLMKMPKIDGYEYTGEFRKANPGDCYYCNIDRGVKQTSIASRFEKIILRKVENWKPLTLEKAVEFYASGNSITWRFAGGEQRGAARTCALTGIYVSAMGQHCVAFPNDGGDTLGIRHTIHRVEYLED